MTKFKPFLIIEYVLIGLFVLVLGAYLLVVANGYRLNIKTWQFEKTGIISLKGELAGAEIFLNGKESMAKKNLVEFRDLFPGKYEIKIGRTSYQSWQKNVNIEPGKVVKEKEIILFYEKPKIEILEGAEKENYQKKFDNIDVKNFGLELLDSEIWFENKLVTRFFQPVNSIFLFPDRNHIVFQIGADIRIIEIDGGNDTKLIELENSESTKIIFERGGRDLIFTDGGNVKKAIVY